MPSVTKPPKYSLHKATGQARVQWEGRSIYLGAHNSAESLRRYDEFIAGLKSTSEPEEKPTLAEPNPDIVLTVGEIVLRYYRHAIGYYVDVDGKQTGEADTIKHALKPLVKRFADLPAREFGPRKLRKVQADMIGLNWSRRYINKATSIVKRAFKWAGSEELVTGETSAALATVAGLKAGRCLAREKDGGRPVKVSR